jgi:o-succinylbenzoate---CoA ligase
VPRRVAVVDPRGDLTALTRALRSALDGTGPALLPVPPEGRAALVAAARPQDGVDDDVALLLPTSGSAGAPRVVELPAAALLASAAATSDRLGGPGRWLLALPLVHVAGWQVLVRGMLCGQGSPPSADPGADPAELAGALAVAGATRVSLVPTQLARLLAHPVATSRVARSPRPVTVLLGGAAATPALLDRAAAAGLRVVTTYGATETCGGCVYDGLPLDGVRVGLGDGGRVLLGGPVLARGYRDGGPGFRDDPATGRWFDTADAGRLDDAGRLHVLGRLDDAVVSGGEKVAPGPVEAVLTGLPGVREALVVGVPDDEWGQAVTALVVPDRSGAPPPGLERARAAVRAAVGAAAAPRHLLVVEDLPRRALGKPDRRAAAALATRRLAHDAGPAGGGPAAG